MIYKQLKCAKKFLHPKERNETTEGVWLQGGQCSAASGRSSDSAHRSGPACRPGGPAPPRTRGRPDSPPAAFPFSAAKGNQRGATASRLLAPSKAFSWKFSLCHSWPFWNGARQCSHWEKPHYPCCSPPTVHGNTTRPPCFLCDRDRSGNNVETTDVLLPEQSDQAYTFSGKPDPFLKPAF